MLSGNGRNINALVYVYGVVSLAHSLSAGGALFTRTSNCQSTHKLSQATIQIKIIDTLLSRPAHTHTRVSASPHSHSEERKWSEDRGEGGRKAPLRFVERNEIIRQIYNLCLEFDTKSAKCGNNEALYISQLRSLFRMNNMQTIPRRSTWQLHLKPMRIAID